MNVPTLPIRTNLEAQYKYGQGITSASSLVSRWNDASGNARHLLQATETNQPLLMPDGSILFDGVDNYLAATFTFTQPETIYLLFKQVTWTGNDYVFDGASVGAMSLQQQGTTPELSLRAGATGPSVTSLDVDTYGVICAVVNGASSVLQHNSNTPVTGDAGSSDGAGFTLGATGGAITFTNIQVKEVLLYSAAHDAPTRRQIVDYLLAVNKTTYTDWYTANGSGVNAGRFRRR